MSIVIYSYHDPYRLKDNKELWEEIIACPYFCVSQTLVNGLKSVYGESFRIGRVTTVSNLQEALYEKWTSTSCAVKQHADIDNIISSINEEQFLTDAQLQNIKKSFVFNRDEVLSSIRTMFTYEKITNATREKFKNQKKYYEIVDSLRNLNISLGIELVRIPILALFNAHENRIISFEVMKKSILYLEHFHFVYNTICSMKVNTIDTIYKSFASALRGAKDKNEGHKVVKEQLIDKLESIWPEYQEFEDKFIQLKYSGQKELKTNMKVKYALNKINNYYEESCFNADDGSIEHILPESSGNESLHIGNLILLEESINSAAGESEYTVKKVDYYIKSKYKWMGKFLLENDTWDISKFEQRAKAMATLYYEKICGKSKN